MSAVNWSEVIQKSVAAGVDVSGLRADLEDAVGVAGLDVGVLLNQIRNERLYEVKGYGSFESFVEREIGLNKALCMALLLREPGSGTRMIILRLFARHGVA